MAKYVIVGGVAGGASTAARLRRLDENAEIILFERGDYISYANCGLPYYAGGEITERERLFVMTPEKFHGWLHVDVRVATNVESIDRENKTVTVKNVHTGAQSKETYDVLILSPGAEALKPPIPGIDLEGIYSLRNVPDIDRIKKHIDEKHPERAVIVGGGFIGLEMAENLHKRGVFVTIVEAVDQVMNVIDFEMAALVHQHLKTKNVELYLGDSVKTFEKRGSRIIITLASGTELDADMVVLSIGVRPDTKIAKDAGLTLAQNGAIVVDEYLRTSDKNIFALGDAVEFPSPVIGASLTIPLAGSANKQARVVADNAVNGNTRVWKGSIGTSIAKVFDITAASAGVSEKLLKKFNIDFKTVITHGSSHASYYPKALPLTIKTIFDSKTGKLLGAQVVGYDGVDKRIELLAETIRRKGFVTDLAEIEHAYAPPFSSAKDPVNINGMAAENYLQGLTRFIDYREIALLKEKGAFLLDVRSSDEFALGSMSGAVNIPNDQVRSRLHEIPRDRTVVVFCGVGLRGYLVERILRQSGWTDIGNLSGGYKTYEIATEKQSNTNVYKRGMGGMQSSLMFKKESLLNQVYAEGSGSPENQAQKSNTVVLVDACGLQCPGPIMRLKTEIDKASVGARVIVRATDPGFARDAQSWCNLTGNVLVSLEEKDSVFQSVIEKAPPASNLKTAGSSLDKAASLIVFSDDLDKALASFVLASGAVAAGKKTTMFFTFWGLSVIKKHKKPSVRKDFLGRMFSFMLPGDAKKLSLSKMNFGGAGSVMMRGRMKAKNVDMLEVMIAEALKNGVRMVACQMSMDIMGVNREELLEGVEIGGVATYMEAASEGNINLFV